jgi:hypothetical protein
VACCAARQNLLGIIYAPSNVLGCLGLVKSLHNLTDILETIARAFLEVVIPHPGLSQNILTGFHQM